MFNLGNEFKENADPITARGIGATFASKASAPVMTIGVDYSNAPTVGGMG